MQPLLNALPAVKASRLTWLTLFICGVFAPSGFSAPLFTQTGSDPAVQEILTSGDQGTSTKPNIVILLADNMGSSPT